jgi:hypothetical protein
VAQIFLCHASEDKPKVREVYHRLRAIEGFEPWLDEEDLLPGQEWEWAISKAMEDSDFILIFLSHTSVTRRGFVHREMRRALKIWQEQPEGTIHTIPVRLEDCDVPESLKNYHWVDLFNPDGFDRMVEAIHTQLIRNQSPKPPIAAVRIHLIYPGIFIFPDTSVEISFDGRSLERASLRDGFQIDITTEVGTHELTLRPMVGFSFREQTYRRNFHQAGQYTVRVSYSRIWGNFNENCEVQFQG